MHYIGSCAHCSMSSSQQKRDCFFIDVEFLDMAQGLLT